VIGNLNEDFLYDRLPQGVIDLDEKGLIQAVVGGIQDRLEDLRAYGKNMQQFFAVNAFPQTGNNVVLVDLQSTQGKLYTRSLDIQTDTPPDGTAALDAWVAAQLGLDETDIIDARYGTDLLRLVDINTLSYLAQTIGAVLYKTSSIPDDQVQAEQQQIIATYFPRLQIKGTERSFDALGRILGFDDVRMMPLWSRLSVRQPSDVGAAANDPDFATESEYVPQQFFSPFYDPLKTDDGPFYTWAGTVNSGTASTQFYTQAINGFSPYITVLVLGVQNGTVVDPADGTYALGTSGTDSLGGPHKKAYVDPAGATVRFQAIAEGADFNGMVINVVTDSTGLNKILSMTERLSAVKYRSSYFDLAITADPDKIEEVFGSSAARRNKDLAANPTLTADGTAISPFRSWVGGSLQSPAVAQDWITLTGTTAGAVVIPRAEASAVNRQLNMDSVIAAGIQVTQAFEEVRAATRTARKSLSGLLLQDSVPYAAYAATGLLGTTTTTFVYLPQDTVNLNEALYVVNASETLYATDGVVFYSSTDAINWTTRGSVAVGTIRAFAYANGMFTAVGDNGIIYTSPTTDTWTAQSSPTTNNLFAIIYGGGQYVAVGDLGTVITSVNAISWSAHAAPVGTEGLFSVVYARGLYVAVGGNGVIVTSSDASTWFLQSSPVAETLFQVIADNNYYITVGVLGGMVASLDGVTWVTRTGDNHDLRAINYFDGRYYYTASAEATLYQSLDGVTWGAVPVKAGILGPFIQLIQLGKSTLVVLSQTTDPHTVGREVDDAAAVVMALTSATVPTGFVMETLPDNSNISASFVFATIATSLVLSSIGTGSNSIDHYNVAGSLISASVSGSFQRNGTEYPTTVNAALSSGFIYTPFTGTHADFSTNVNIAISAAHVP